MGEVAGDVTDIRDHSRGGRLAACATPVVHGVVAHVAVHHRGVENAVDVRKHVRERDERGMHTDLDLAAVARDACEELDAISEIRGVFHVVAGEIADALDLNLLKRGLEAVCERGEDAGLVRRVETVDVERRIRLGVAELLRILEDFVEGLALVLHAGENVVAGAV